MHLARIFELQRKSTLALRPRKATLLRQLRLPPEVLRASGVEPFLTCGKAACPCHQSPERKHGPYCDLTLCLGMGRVRQCLGKAPEQQPQARFGTAACARFMEGGGGALPNQRRTAPPRRPPPGQLNGLVQPPGAGGSTDPQDPGP